MAQDVFTPLASEVLLTTSGEGALVNTSVDENSQSQDVNVYLNITAAGTGTIDITYVTEIDGVDFLLASVAQQSGVAQVITTIANAPLAIKAVYTVAGGAPTFSFTAHVNRIGTLV